MDRLDDRLPQLAAQVVDVRVHRPECVRVVQGRVEQLVASEDPRRPARQRLQQSRLTARQHALPVATAQPLLTDDEPPLPTTSWFEAPPTGRSSARSLASTSSTSN